MEASPRMCIAACPVGGSGAQGSPASCAGVVGECSACGWWCARELVGGGSVSTRAHSGLPCWWEWCAREPRLVCVGGGGVQCVWVGVVRRVGCVGGACWCGSKPRLVCGGGVGVQCVWVGVWEGAGGGWKCRFGGGPWGAWGVRKFLARMRLLVPPRCAGVVRRGVGGALFQTKWGCVWVVGECSACGWGWCAGWGAWGVRKCLARMRLTAPPRVRGWGSAVRGGGRRGGCVGGAQVPRPHAPDSTSSLCGGGAQGSWWGVISMNWPWGALWVGVWEGAGGGWKCLHACA